MAFKATLDKILTRLASRKFLTTIAVQIACLYAFFRPTEVHTAFDLAVKIAALVTMVLAAFGYGYIEASVDKKAMEYEEQDHETNETNSTEGE